MKLTFLGTSAGGPTKERNASSIALQLPCRRNLVWLFDCGEGTVRQFSFVPFRQTKIEKIFITHLHGDHLFGLPFLLSNLTVCHYNQKLCIYGPVGLKNYLEVCLATVDIKLSFSLEVIEIEEDGIIFQDEQFTIKAISLQHRVPCFGYRIEEKNRLGSLNVDKLAKDNVDIPMVAKWLKKGEDVALSDGRTIKSAEYLGPNRVGRVVAIFGDTKPTPNQFVLAQNADLIVHEATNEHVLEEKTVALGHSTTTQTAQMAKDANVKRLIITHISPRYSLIDNERLVSECRLIFPQTEIASDFDSFFVPAETYET